MSTVQGGQGNIITNGLVLNLDAANPRSYDYPYNGTIWNDLSGNGNNGTLINGVGYNSSNGGSLVFDGVDDRVSRNSAIDTGQNFTINAWIFPTLLGTTRRTIMSNNYLYSSRRGWFFSTGGFSTNNTFFLSIGADLSYRTAAANTLSINTWQYVTAIVTDGGQTITLLKNANSTDTAASSLTSGTITYNDIGFNVGYRTSIDPDIYNGRIPQVSLYNRALSVQEVLQNFNATRARFGV
jgi:hypothetical protein